MKLIKLSVLLFGMVTVSATAQESAEEVSEVQEERIVIEVEMREAEEKLAEAARRIAELSQRNLPMFAPEVEMLFEQNSTPRLGVMLSSNDAEGPVSGVTLTAITPGSAAAEAGLRAGDIVTAINAQSLNAETNQLANDKLVSFMSDAKHGDKLDIEYLRDGDAGKLTATLTPGENEMRRFVFRNGPDGETFDFMGPHPPGIHVAPPIERELAFGPAMFWAGKQWGDMELVELSEGLGRYFGAKSGLLVVSVPEQNTFELQDGDVIVTVDDREPESVGHLLRILTSYAPGESLELKIMRDKKRRTIKLTMPEERVGSLMPEAPLPPVAPEPAQPATAVRPPISDDQTHETIRT